ncbi:hypothetical protein [Candidatus Nitrosotalea okcheonensis]|uniref:Uncharacterized protein n=1 Tax=Candidatus Nitrosotalea okcheonensis TaxID=1903276 RepID=A0A2H1FCV9_9ARCH|nr:hypothetical protein [Candidatus Nitrosotalea okcheonensis]MDE1728131.1 hypothetical protein [Nitrososphaerota archaeon]MDE1830890.1 hypothetical protein [Nitrososphaerota archaeon]MDE1840848.1 hypothetical protein [Nitrososphaerota archaeon]MDE1877088.1 hypothetical protein [Nitrososphaerota archaeon]SMH70600.1 protein of unknown function [Candidatus Nitrosotalea okcheonensis]
MHSKKPNVFDILTTRLGDEFPQFSRIRADWEFVLTEKKSGEVKNTKKFQILVIQNDLEKYQHVGIIISELSSEYVQLPALVEKFLSEIKKTIEVNVGETLGEKKIFDMSGLQFTGNVYLYADRLLVAEDAVQKHFKKNNLDLHLRVEKRILF